MRSNEAVQVADIGWGYVIGVIGALGCRILGFEVTHQEFPKA